MSRYSTESGEVPPGSDQSDGLADGLLDPCKSLGDRLRSTELPTLRLHFASADDRQAFVNLLVEGLRELAAARLTGDALPDIPARYVERWGLE